MKKIISFFVLFILLSCVTSFAVPNGEMTFGSMSQGLPEDEFRKYWQKAYPEMEKIFGQPYSSFTFIVEYRPDLKEYEGGWDPIRKAVMSETGSNYFAFLEQGHQTQAINSVLNGATHELSHGMYTHSDKIMGFPLTWINEGWALTTQTITWARLKNEMVRPTIYLTQFLDEDLVAGTEAWGAFKQTKNHRLVYDSTSMAHFNLLYACSDSNLEPDFQKRMNEKIYDEYVIAGKLNEFSKLPLEEYKKIIKELCADKKIDGRDAYQWYFSQPAAFTEGSTGFHVGVFPHYWGFTGVRGMDVFTFSRVKTAKGLSEQGVSAQVKVSIFNNKREKIYDLETETDQDGNAFIDFNSDFLSDGSYYATAESEYGDEKFQSKIFFIALKTGPEVFSTRVTGVLVDKNMEPLDSRYISVLKPLGDAKIVRNSNGLFIAEVPSLETKEVSFDFLEKEYVFTKPPFNRVVVLQLSDDLIEKAEQRPEFAGFREEESETEESFKELKEIKQRPPHPESLLEKIFHRLIERLTSLFGFG